MKFITPLMVLILTMSLGTYGAKPAIHEAALSMVPRGTLLSQIRREITIKTNVGSRVKIEFSRDGSLDEASGVGLGKGDQLEPGNGLISLSSAAQVLTALGHKLKGPWHLEKDSTAGWIYEFEGEQEEENKEYLVDAKTGKLIKKES